MMFTLRMGVPDMEALWLALTEGADNNTLSASEKKLFKKLVKALDRLRTDPYNNSLQSHEIDTLTKKYKIKIFQSYLENKTPSAGRMFWAYGPGKREITILGIEPHPDRAKRGAYERIKLSTFPT